MRIIFAAIAFTIELSAAAGGGGILYAGGGWAAVDRGAVCEALARSALRAPPGKVQATAGFAFTPDRRRWGEFHARLSRAPRAGSSVMLDIGGQPFLLAARGDGRGAADRRRSRRSSPPLAMPRRCGSRRVTPAAGALSIFTGWPARRRRSTPPRRAARFAALAKSADLH